MFSLSVLCPDSDISASTLDSSHVLLKMPYPQALLPSSHSALPRGSEHLHAQASHRTRGQGLLVSVSVSPYPGSCTSSAVVGTITFLRQSKVCVHTFPETPLPRVVIGA